MTTTTMAATRRTTTRCARCQRKLTPDTWVYSRHTGNHYCRDIDACTKRTRKAAKA